MFDTGDALVRGFIQPIKVDVLVQRIDIELSLLQRFTLGLQCFQAAAGAFAGRRVGVAGLTGDRHGLADCRHDFAQGAADTCRVAVNQAGAVMSGEWQAVNFDVVVALQQFDVARSQRSAGDNMSSRVGLHLAEHIAESINLSAANLDVTGGQQRFIQRRERVERRHHAANQTKIRQAANRFPFCTVMGGMMLAATLGGRRSIGIYRRRFGRRDLLCIYVGFKLLQLREPALIHQAFFRRGVIGVVGDCELIRHVDAFPDKAAVPTSAMVILLMSDVTGMRHSSEA